MALTKVSRGLLSTSIVDNGNATAITIDANENVGIGTSSPASLLDVSSTGSVVSTIRSTSTSGARGAKLRLNVASTGGDDPAGTIEFTYGTGYTVAGSITMSHSNNAMRFSTGTTERLRIDANGNILVGTTTHRDFSGDTTEITVGTTATGATKGGAVTFGSGSGFLGYLAFQESEGTLGTLTSVPLVFKTGNTERMRIDASGQVGIGTSSPSAPIEITRSNAGIIQYITNTSSNQAYTAYGNSDNPPWSQDFNTAGGLLVGIDSDETAIVYQGGNKALRFGTNATERMRIDASGNVGIGATSVTGNLQILTATAGSVLNVNHNTSNIYPKASGIGLGATSTALTVSSDGSTVSFTGGAGLYAENTAASGNPTNLVFWTNLAGSPAEAMRIDASGNLLVGTTSTSIDTSSNASGFNYKPGNCLTVATTVGGNSNIILNKSNSSQGNVVDIRYNGSIVGRIFASASGTQYIVSSDQRLKNNIVDAPSASNDIDAIQVRSFDWKADGSHQKYGMVAQELQSVAPEAVSIPEDPEEMMGVDYSKIVPMLVKEIQSLRARVQQLENN